MAQPRAVSIRPTLRKLFPSSLLKRWAHDSGAVVRLRRVDPVALFWTVVLGFGAGNERTLAGLRRSYERATHKSIEESSFYCRFTPGLVGMLKQAVGHALQQSLSAGRPLVGALAQFADVLITDSTVVKLHDLLAKTFPACRTNHTKAALKAHAIISVTGKGKQSIKVTSERRHDGPVLRVGPWVMGRLFLFDLGYFCYKLFARIDECGGFFLARLKSNANPIITAVYRGASGQLVGAHLLDVLDRLKRDVLDIEVEVKLKRRQYAGHQRRDKKRFRVVGVRDAQTRAWHLYITNIPVERLPAEDVRSTYALRWEIELLWRELKQHYRLDQFPSSKRDVVEALLYAAILTLVISRALLALMRRKLSRSHAHLPQHRFAVLVSMLASELLALVLGRSSAFTRQLDRVVLRTLRLEAPDQNRNRRGLLGNVENRTHCYDKRPRQNATKRCLYAA